jgi:1-acyl-sn-glycerol-3-phosphate acyltransferase
MSGIADYLMLLSRLRAYLLIDPLIVLATVVMGTLSLATSFVDRTGRIPHAIARAWSKMLLAVSGVKVKTEGIEKISLRQSYVIASNHLSLMDTPLVLAYIPLQFRFLAKRGLFRIPFIGHHLRRAGHIPIPREDPKGSLMAMSQAAKIIREYQVSVLLFPEGGRSEDGVLQEFKEGVAYIAIKAGVPVVPVAVSGTREILPVGSVHVRPGRAILRVGDPIPTQGLTLHDRGKLTQQVRHRILDLLQIREQNQPVPVKEEHA